MSRVDEALRRAALDPTSLHSPAGRTSADVMSDESALDRYSTEKPSTTEKAQAKPTFDGVVKGIVVLWYDET